VGLAVRELEQVNLDTVAVAIEKMHSEKQTMYVLSSFIYEDGQ
jgi:hypothetical protein